MKKYLSIFNLQTLLVTGLSLLSCYLSVRFELRIYADFLIIGLIIVFPLTFSMREAFKRRERCLQYLSLMKASLQSVFYSLQNSKLGDHKTAEFGNIAQSISETLIRYLSKASDDVVAVEQSAHAMATFFEKNRKMTKRDSLKILLFISKINESIEFLLAVRRHRTPWGPRAIVLFAIYLLAILYPASVLFAAGAEFQLWNLFLMTEFKVLILISLYNVQGLLEDPFNQNSPDGIRLNDFRFTRESGPPAPESLKMPLYANYI